MYNPDLQRRKTRGGRGGGMLFRYGWTKKSTWSYRHNNSNIVFLPFWFYILQYIWWVGNKTWKSPFQSATPAACRGSLHYSHLPSIASGQRQKKTDAVFIIASVNILREHQEQSRQHDQTIETPHQKSWCDICVIDSVCVAQVCFLPTLLTEMKVTGASGRTVRTSLSLLLVKCQVLFQNPLCKHTFTDK